MSDAPVARARTLAEASTRRDNNFNLIRLVAAWAVIFGHSHALAVWGGPDPVWSLLKIKFSGTVAVDVFFVVSGFLITASLERNTLRTFLASRALRIFPALLACVSACVFVLGPLLTTADDYWTRPETWRYFTANVGLSMNTAYFLPGVFAGRTFESINASLWSLPVEVRCYLALAVLGALSLHRRWRFNVLFALGLAAGFVVLWPRTCRGCRRSATTTSATGCTCTAGPRSSWCRCGSRRWGRGAIRSVRRCWPARARWRRGSWSSGPRCGSSRACTCARAPRCRRARRAMRRHPRKKADARYDCERLTGLSVLTSASSAMRHRYRLA